MSEEMRVLGRPSPLTSFTSLGGSDIIVTVTDDAQEGVQIGSAQSLKYTLDEQFEWRVEISGLILLPRSTEGHHIGPFKDLIEPLKRGWTVNIVVVGTNEYGGAACLAFKNVKLIQLRGAISVESTMLDEKVLFSCRDVEGWKSLEFKSPTES